MVLNGRIIQNHLGELILTISKASNDSNLERHMWYIVRDVLDNIFDQLVLSPKWF
jgi:siderophore synthetase component